MQVGTPVRRRHLAKLSSAAIAGAALALTAMGPPALAADPANSASGTADVGNGVSVHVKPDSTKPATEIVPAGEIQLKVGSNPPATSYCVDYHHPLSTGNTYREESWKDSQISNLGKVQWIINNSFPKVSVAKVAQAASADLTGVPQDRAEHLVYAATQVAIWHFSDGVTLADRAANWLPADQDWMPPKATPTSPQLPVVPKQAQYALIQKLYDHLTAAKTDEEPAPTLRIEPSTKSGPIGGKAGPFTVRSGGAEVTLTATGGKLVDGDGKPVTKLADGGTFWATSDTGAQVAIKATATGTVPSGRVFVAKNGANVHQKIILAGTTTTELVTAATATFSAQVASSSSAANQNTLPVTGASVTVAVATGLVLLAGGALALMVARRRRRVTFTA